MVDIKLQELRRFKGHNKIVMDMDLLQPGQTMRLTNIHDPKVLHYVFETYYKGKYEWVSEQEESRDNWVVTVRKK